MVEEANTYPISAKKKIDTVNKIEESQKLKEIFFTSKNNKPDTLNSIYKSRSTKRTNLSNRSTRIENPQK